MKTAKGDSIISILLSRLLMKTRYSFAQSFTMKAEDQWWFEETPLRKMNELIIWLAHEWTLRCEVLVAPRDVQMFRYLVRLQNQVSMSLGARYARCDPFCIRNLHFLFALRMRVHLRIGDSPSAPRTHFEPIFFILHNFYSFSSIPQNLLHFFSLDFRFIHLS